MTKKFIGITIFMLCLTILLCSCQIKKTATTLYENDENTDDAVSLDEALASDIESSEASIIVSSESNTEAVSADAESIKSETAASENGITDDSSESDEWVDPDAPQTKEEEINGENIVFKYTISKKATGVQVHDRNEYTAENGAVVDYDRVTGQLLLYHYNDYEDNGKNNITEEELKLIAEKFIKQYCDITKYTGIEIKYNEYTGYMVDYSKMIYGYKTSEGVTVMISSNNKVTSFIYNPYVFDNVTVPEFNEDELVAKLENEMKTNFGDRYIGYEIDNKRIILDENGKPAMEYSVERKHMENGEECTDGYNYMYTL